MDYNSTLNLPKTEFPMRAGLPMREPAMLKDWEEKSIYAKLMEKNAGKPLYILHDGPPYANGDIHMGTAMNKVLKDFIVRYKNMSGFRAPYVPGWDTHGLPIESQIIKKSKLDRSKMTVPEFRDKCRDFALGFVDTQRGQFMRLGGIGDWFNPYLTLAPEFEACQIEVFGEIYEKGLIYKGLKPVYWCPHDETALAEAEVEYMDQEVSSIYVKFRVEDDKGKLLGLDLSKTFFVIWTTTTWTLPGNVAISVNPGFEYCVASAGGENYIVASELLESVMKAAGIDDYSVGIKLSGADLEHMKTRHPFLDRDSLIITGDHVTLDAGSGCVHTAPGHGHEDFAACRGYDLPVIVPVDAKGFMTEEAGRFAGLYYAKAGAPIEELLSESGLLLATQKISHTYPHCWRCKHPVVYRATEQWFCSVDAIKDAAEKACRGAEWSPAWGEERMVSMVRERSDWCISRQRNWGVPIPIFYCGECKKALINRDTINKVSSVFASEGSNSWFAKDASELLPEGIVCPECGCASFTQETDIMDVWFDSGVTHAAVLEKREELQSPADLYLEGGDQYRGWFQSSLLTSVATKGTAPFKNVLSHGWIVDGEGKKMSKSLGNTILPGDIIKDYGADILRLWVSSADYRNDVRISKEIFKQLSEIYLKIRNTCRFILGNLEGFDPDSMAEPSSLLELDLWALSRLNRLTEKVTQAYEDNEFHIIYHSVHNFCVVELSNFYLDVIKDRLYCSGKDSHGRLSAQTAMYLILDALVRMMAPILAFTSEEIWSFMPHEKGADAESVLFNAMPSVSPEFELGADAADKWERLLALRTEVNLALEAARRDKLIGKPLEACVTIRCGAAERAFLQGVLPELGKVFIVSEVRLEDGPEGIEISRAGGEKCVRCWTYSHEIGGNESHPELCERCAGVVSAQA